MDFEFHESDFSKLIFPVHNMPDNIDPVKQFDRLKKWPELNLTGPILKRNKIFRWIVYVYDKESPFRIKVGDITKRKLEVAKYVKLIDDFKSISDDVKEIVTGENKEINKAIVAYIRLHRNSKYALVVGLDNKFYEDLLKIHNGGTPKDSISDTQRELEEAVSELLNQDNTPALIDTLFSYIEDDRINYLRPEGMAEMLSQKKDPFKGKTIASETY
jgi:hypothetical protein